jgi:spore coat polysaccharide biosynthesis protein SpsF
MRIFAIIQARMSSSRLPGKVLSDLGGIPMIQWIVERAGCAKTLNGVVVATTVESSDDAVAKFCQNQGVTCFRGSLHDVLDRYYQAALELQADVIVRLTGDCPLIDPGVIDETVRAFLETPGTDFAANRLPPPWRRSFPIGLDVEVCSFFALERAWKEAKKDFHREHVMLYLYEGLAYGTERTMRETYRTPYGFNVVLINHEPDYGDRRWTVDTAEDLELVRQIVSRIGIKNFNWQDIIKLLAHEPDLERLNAGVQHKTAFDVDNRR